MGTPLEHLGKGFINLVKMLIAPIIFCIMVYGIASRGDWEFRGTGKLRSSIDNHATTRVAPEVLEAMRPGLDEASDNSSAGYRLGRAADKVIVQARGQV